MIAPKGKPKAVMIAPKGKKKSYDCPEGQAMSAYGA